MRLEQINENQIRCFLTKQEMESRNLKLKELAYGTENARRLFHELMQEAYKQFGFQSDNMPVMIEAVPLHDDSLVLIISRIENPEELDTRYSSFAPFVKSGSEDADLPDSSVLSQLLDRIRHQEDRADGEEAPEGKHRQPSPGKSSAGSPAQKNTALPEQTGSGFRGLKGSGLPGQKAGGLSGRRGDSAGKAGGGNPDASGRKDMVLQPQLYTFRVLGKAAEAAAMASPYFRGPSSLYRDPADSRYYLFLSPSKEDSAPDLQSALSIFSEFGSSEYITPAREQHLREHCQVLCAGNAVQQLAALES